MPSKGFFQSKINWLGILIFIAGAGAYTDQLPPSVTKWVLMASGIAAVILRTFGTSTVIKGGGQ